jgi:hypothetical protein
LEALEEPQSKERVDDQATGERIDAEEAGELPWRARVRAARATSIYFLVEFEFHR